MHITLRSRLLLQFSNYKRTPTNGHSALWDNLKEEMLDQPDSSSEDEAQEFEDIPPGDHLLMGIGSVVDILSLHPSVVHIFRLWQIFLDNCNPLIKTFHAPSVQQIIIDASGDLTSLTKPNEALLFSVYFLAIVSLSNEECEHHFGQPRQKLLAKYTRGVHQALVNAKFLRSLNLTTLQAFTLYLIGGRRIYDPLTIWTLSGVAVRIAQRLGIHTDMGSSKFTPFEAEMRRRTWWQIVFLDGHASKMAGAPFPAVRMSIDCFISLLRYADNNFSGFYVVVYISNRVTHSGSQNSIPSFRSTSAIQNSIPP